MTPYRFTGHSWLPTLKQWGVLSITALALIGCGKHSPQRQEAAVERPSASTQSLPTPAATNSSTGVAAPAEEGDGPEYQEAANFVRTAMREGHVKTLRDLEGYAEQTQLKPATWKAMVRVVESMETVVGPENVKPPVKGKYVDGLRLDLLTLSLATQTDGHNAADALARQLQDQLATGLIAGETLPLYLKADALRSLANRRGIYDVEGILAMPEAKDLPEPEKDAIRSLLSSG